MKDIDAKYGAKATPTITFFMTEPAPADRRFFYPCGRATSTRTTSAQFTTWLVQQYAHGIRVTNSKL